ncbi:MAG: GDP-mannose 4,6-dehydratase [Planctomycetes bacterium]|nr:GDP-mannose 4,6-dehydratase [Planctomycetota bacterium]
MQKRALITGITGQDGSYLAELLLEKGYEVHGLVRPSTHRRTNIDHIRERLQLHYGDISDAIGLGRVIDAVAPDELYNLAAQSQVRLSFDDPVYTSEIAALGNVHVLEILRKSHPHCRFYQASSSEMFGLAPPPQSEASPFLPQSPYAVAKLHAHHMVRIYRQAFGIYACSGILFNHESPRRGEDFVTRKITRAVAEIAAGRQQELVLGNTAGRRDWGYAREYVEAMWLMLQQHEPEDFVIATGVTHAVQDVVEIAFAYAGLEWDKYVAHDPELYRPTDPSILCGDPRKAREKLGWSARTTLEELVKLMLDADLREAKPAR